MILILPAKMSALRGSTCLFKRILFKGTIPKSDFYINRRTISSLKYLYRPVSVRPPIGVCACVFFRRSNERWIHIKNVLYNESVTSDSKANSEKEDTKKSKWKKYGEYFMWFTLASFSVCLLYTSDAADDMQCVDLGGRRIIKRGGSAVSSWSCW